MEICTKYCTQKKKNTASPPKILDMNMAKIYIITQSNSHSHSLTVF